MTSLDWIASELHRLREIVTRCEPGYDEGQLRLLLVQVADRLMSVEEVARGAPIPDAENEPDTRGSVASRNYSGSQ